jgi:hypothetical protein
MAHLLKTGFYFPWRTLVIAAFVLQFSIAAIVLVAFICTTTTPEGLASMTPERLEHLIETELPRGTPRAHVVQWLDRRGLDRRGITHSDFTEFNNVNRIRRECGKWTRQDSIEGCFTTESVRKSCHSETLPAFRRFTSASRSYSRGVTRRSAILPVCESKKGNEPCALMWRRSRLLMGSSVSRSSGVQMAHTASTGNTSAMTLTS